MFDETSIKKSDLIGDLYKKAATENSCYYIDLGKIASVSDIDGLHYEPEEHKKIADAMFKTLCRIFDKFPFFACKRAIHLLKW